MVTTLVAQRARGAPATSAARSGFCIPKSAGKMGAFPTRALG